jgi:hypothetical protein
MDIKQQWALGGLGIVIVAGAFFLARPSEEPVAPTPEGTTEVTNVQVPEDAKSGEDTMSEVVKKEVAPIAPNLPVFTLNAKDKISSWQFKGTYLGNDTLVAKAKADIAHLESLLGKGEYKDYDLYTGIGNDYTYLGEGGKAYEAYQKAFNLEPERAIVYMNIGNLMEYLRAYHTAKDAYARAVAVEPGMLQYQRAQADFLERQLPTTPAE